MTEKHSSESLVAAVRPTARWRQIYELLRVRLRFVVVLVLMAVVVGQWETITTHANRWIDRVANRLTGQGVQAGVSADTEYFCPMCPGVLSGWPDTCPVCNMPLVRRRKGEAVLLPSGVVARMQFSTQRVQLAGLQTSNVAYRPLAYRWEAIGRVVDDAARKSDDAVKPADGSSKKENEATESEFPIEALVAASEAQRLAGVQQIDVWSEPRTGITPWKARLVTSRPALNSPGFVMLRLLARAGNGESTTQDSATSDSRSSDSRASDSSANGMRLPPGSLVRLEFVIPAATTTPFRDEPRGVPEPIDGEPRSAYLCPDHLDHVHVKAGKCPIDSKPLVAVPLANNQRIRWRCGAHSDVLGVGPDATCDRCPGCPLAASIVTFAPPGEVLAVPSSAVIDTGRETVVYLETGPGMFDGVKVRLGPRCGDEFPVIEGLAAGQRVVTRGTFLVDAEARLNPSLASAYFGAVGADSAGSSPAPASPLVAAKTTSSNAATAETPHAAADPRVVRKLLAKFDMTSADRDLAIRQGVCPVTDEPLGSMGKPPKKMVDGKPVFICCEGCAGSLAEAVQKRQAKSPSSTPATTPSSPTKSP